MIEDAGPQLAATVGPLSVTCSADSADGLVSDRVRAVGHAGYSFYGPTDRERGHTPSRDSQVNPSVTLAHDGGWHLLQFGVCVCRVSGIGSVTV